MRRGLWGPLLIVVGLLVGASAYARRDQLDLAPVRAAAGATSLAVRNLLVRAEPMIASGVAHLRAQPLPWVVGGGLLLLLGAIVLVRRRRRRAGEHPAGDAEAAPAFEAVLESALVPGGADGRHRRVTVLARDGHSIGEIARATRLSQDAIRTVLDAG